MENKERFINILSQAQRTGIVKVLEMLERTDFYTAPASAKYHGAHQGGLLEHSLNVFDCMVDKLALEGFKAGYNDNIFSLCNRLKGGKPLSTNEGTNSQDFGDYEKLEEVVGKVFNKKVTLAGFILVPLLHDMHKLNVYESYDKSVFGGYDQGGRKIWNTETAYKRREDAFVMGDSGATSAYILSSYIKLTYEETLAIMNHHGFTDNGFQQLSASKAWGQSKFALYLHLADMEAAYSLEK